MAQYFSLHMRVCVYTAAPASAEVNARRLRSILCAALFARAAHAHDRPALSARPAYPLRESNMTSKLRASTPTTHRNRQVALSRCKLTAINKSRLRATCSSQQASRASAPTTHRNRQIAPSRCKLIVTGKSHIRATSPYQLANASFTRSKKDFLPSYSLPVSVSSNWRSSSFCFSLSLRGISTFIFMYKSPLPAPRRFCTP